MRQTYDPAKGVNQAVAGQQNLVFTTSSSKLWCDGVTLKITNTGMRLTKGTLQFDRKNSIYSDANLTDTSHGLMLGDGIFWNDPQIILGPDSRLSLESGVLEYDLIEDGYLKYGDGTAFKHSSYGFYLSNSALGAGGAYGNNALGDFDLSNGSRLYVLPGTSSTRFGTGFIGTRVLSGDTIKLESFTDSKTQSSVQGGNVFLTNTGSQVTGAFTLQSQATLSSPTPPYAQARFNFFADAMRIYKKGASVGSPIAIGDQVYFQYGYYSYAVWYFGSSNLTYSTNYKEVFWYQMSDFSPTTPPNFVSNYLWNIDTIIKKAYLNAGPDFNLSVTNPSAAWAANPPSAYQF